MCGPLHCDHLHVVHGKPTMLVIDKPKPSGGLFAGSEGGFQGKHENIRVPVSGWVLHLPPEGCCLRDQPRRDGE